MSEEIWKDVAGFEGFYQISNMGHLRSLDRERKHSSSSKTYVLKGKNISPCFCSDGYHIYSLSMRGKRITKKFHRLVAEAFIPNPDSKKTVNHINGIKTDNRAENLEWATTREQVEHAIKIGIRDYRGEGNPRARLSELDVKKIKTKYASIEKMANDFGVSKGAVGNIFYKNTWNTI